MAAREARKERDEVEVAEENQDESGPVGCLQLLPPPLGSPFWELPGPLLKAWAENRENLDFLTTVQHFLRFFMVPGYQNRSKIAPTSLREASLTYPAPAW